jgi:hypothetical protein
VVRFLKPCCGVALLWAVDRFGGFVGEVMIEVGRHVESALPGSAELGQLFQSAGTAAHREPMIVVIIVFPRRRSGWE